ncbi:DUF1129 family protein [Oceanobacillus sojae]|uniref:DUF1129 domain-containing protein n=1 Tax=Oceanobacillus sojae TaxID=582851 RepID=A0A511ZEK8_9BACI|nr:DUF1129 family protein [Oceanobacillus sojae]GEN85883.1 hypothetical protein OSO01_06220 [Oceanobacillus sojae]
MNVKQMIEENNQKREQLTVDNEKYYSDLMLYIRTNWQVSEQHTEELLLELLNHLLEGQQEGKTAIDIFGEEPKEYADQLIEQLPEEEKRSWFTFFASLFLFQIVPYVLIIRGVVLLVLPLFTEVNDQVNIFKLLITAILLGVMAMGVVRYIMNVIHRSVFKKNHAEWKDSVKVGAVAAAGMGAFILISVWLPEIGPSFRFTWWLSLLLGGVIWGMSKVVKSN